MIVELGPCEECGRSLADPVFDHLPCIAEGMRRVGQRIGERMAQRAEEEFFAALEVKA